MILSQDQLRELVTKADKACEEAAAALDALLKAWPYRPASIHPLFLLRGDLLGVVWGRLRRTIADDEKVGRA